MFAADEHPMPFLVDEVLRTQGRIVAAVGQLAAEEGLTGAQTMVLVAVVRAQRPPTVPQIGRSLGRARQSVQRLTDILVEMGLVECKANPDHKRAPLLVPTVAGRELYARLDRRSRVWIARVTEGLDEKDLVATTATLRTVRRRLEQDPAAPRRDAE